MKLTSVDLGKQAYEKVKSLIISKQLEPGQKIVQGKLADELGISRTPLRHGLQMLEAESLVESIPRKGVIVKSFSELEILEIYDCRIALEGTAIRLFAEKASQQEIDILNSLLLPFETGKIDERAYQKADSKFHNTIIKNCGNTFLYKLFQKGNLLVHIDMIGLVRPPHQTLQEHLDIVSAVNRKDIDLAEKLIKNHLEKSKQLILKKLEDGS